MGKCVPRRCCKTERVANARRQVQAYLIPQVLAGVALNKPEIRGVPVQGSKLGKSLGALVDGDQRISVPNSQAQSLEIVLKCRICEEQMAKLGIAARRGCCEVLKHNVLE